MPSDPSIRGCSAALETAVFHLIPIVERVRARGSVGSYAEFADLAAHFYAGWKAVREQRYSAADSAFVDDSQQPSPGERIGVAGLLDLFITLWCATSARLVQFAALRFNLIRCAAATAGVFCAAVEGISAASRAETPELSVSLEILLEVSRDLLGFAEASDAAKGCWAEVECADEQLDTLNATADCGGILPSFQLPCALVLVSDLVHRMLLFLAAAHSSTTADASFATGSPFGGPYFAPLTRMQHALRTRLARVEAADASYFVSTVVMPSLWSENWDANSKYFGARMPSHGLTFALGQLLVHTREWLLRLCAHSDAPPRLQLLLALDAHAREIASSQVGRVLFSCWSLLLERYVQFLSSTTMSSVRREQALCDALYLIRWTRFLRHLLGCGEEYRVLVRLSLTLVAAVSVVGCSTDVGSQLRRVASASAGDDATQDAVSSLHDEHAAFVDVIWGVAPLEGSAELVACSSREVCLPHLPIFVRPVAHGAVATVVPPQPLSSLSWLSPEDWRTVHPGDREAAERCRLPLWRCLDRDLLHALLDTHHPLA